MKTKFAIQFSVFCILISILFGCAPIEEKNIQLYFVSADKKEIVSETRSVPAGTEEDLEKILAELLKGPQKAGLTRIIPTNTKVLSVRMQGTVAEINLSADFENGNTDARLLSRYTMIYTACAVPAVQKARLLVEGTPLTSLRDGSVLGALGTADVSLSDWHTETAQVMNLYFGSGRGSLLLSESRQFGLSQGERLEEAVIKELILGPKTEGLIPVLSPETVLLSAETREGICFVDFGENFLTENAGLPAQEMLAIYGVVNSLCTLPGVEKVRFFIEGETVESLGHYRLNRAFLENTALYEQPETERKNDEGNI